MVLDLSQSVCESLSCVQLFATPWTVGHQAPLSMEFFQARVLEWAAISFSIDTCHLYFNLRKITENKRKPHKQKKIVLATFLALLLVD